MGAPPAQFSFLRDVVGPGPSDLILKTAWEHARGDLAAAVNIVLDGSVSRTTPPAPRQVSPAPDVAANDVSQAISLDDSDTEAVMQPLLAGSASSVGTGVVRDQSQPGVKKERNPDTKSTGTTTALFRTPPQEKRRSVESQAPAAPARPVPTEDWAFSMGTARIEAYSTIRVSGEQKFQGPDGEFGPLLRPGGRLDLRWSLDAKKPKHHPKTAPTSLVEGGTIRFSACSMEIGRFPSGVGKTLVPLLIRRLIDVEACVGPQPPRELSTGTNVPVVLRVSLRSSALCAPSQVGRKAPSAPAPATPGVASAALKGSKLSKAAQAAHKDEADAEVLRSTTLQLLELLNLPRRRGASDVSDAPVAGEVDTVPRVDTADADDNEDDADAPTEMSMQAAAQLGSAELLERHHTPVVVMPHGCFNAQLRRYQAQAVYWMWRRENPYAELPLSMMENQEDVAPKGNISKTDEAPPLHPMWDEYELPQLVGPFPDQPIEEPVGFIYHHRTTGSFSIVFPDAALALCRGGILGDDMGLGKTVMCLALLALDYAPGVETSRTAARRTLAQEGAVESAPTTRPHVTPFVKQATENKLGGTLVVAPISLLTQWANEIQRHMLPNLRPSVHQHHGSGRQRTVEQLRSYGVVMTTYSTIGNEKADAPIFQVYWQRVILDEAHYIKNRCSQMAQAVFNLRAFSRWAVTGTPMQNNVDELYPLIRFLQIDPWSAWPMWRKSVSLPLQRNDAGSMVEALDAARGIVQPIMIRRTKSSKDPLTGEHLLTLPPKHVHTVRLELSPAERDFYDALFKNSKTQFDTFIARGEALSMYTHILQLVLKLRQALCHPFLVFAREGAKDEDLAGMEQRCLREMTCADGFSERFVGNLLEDLRKGDIADCPICCDAPEDPAITPCGHIFCRECAIKAIAKCAGECPVCRRKGLDRKSLRVLPGASRFPSRLLARASGEGAEGGTAASAHSTKMKELLKFLGQDMEAGRRAVVFSQWTSFLDLVGSALEGASIPFRRFDGSLSREQRGVCVDWLSDQPGTGGRVLIVSLRAGGVGLNLVAASRLYLLDLWWNPAVEEQAIQRVHRIGQTSEVHVYRLVIENSMDTAILELQAAKARLLEEAITGGGANLEGASKLGLNDLKRLFNPCKMSLEMTEPQQAKLTQAAGPTEVTLLSESNPSKATLVRVDRANGGDNKRTPLASGLSSCVTERPVEPPWQFGPRPIQSEARQPPSQVTAGTRRKWSVAFGAVASHTDTSSVAKFPAVGSRPRPNMSGMRPPSVLARPSTAEVRPMLEDDDHFHYEMELDNLLSAQPPPESTISPAMCVAASPSVADATSTATSAPRPECNEADDRRYEMELDRMLAAGVEELGREVGAVLSSPVATVCAGDSEISCACQQDMPGVADTPVVDDGCHASGRLQHVLHGSSTREAGERTAGKVGELDLASEPLVCNRFSENCGGADVVTDDCQSPVALVTAHESRSESPVILRKGTRPLWDAGGDLNGPLWEAVDSVSEPLWEYEGSRNTEVQAPAGCSVVAADDGDVSDTDLLAAFTAVESQVAGF